MGVSARRGARGVGNAVEEGHVASSLAERHWRRRNRPARGAHHRHPGLVAGDASSEGEDASAGADEVVEAARTTTRAREATQRRRCAKRGAKNAGDATGGMAADARVAVCCDRGGGRNETRGESRTPRGALRAGTGGTGLRPDRRTLPRRDAERRASAPRPRLGFRADATPMSTSRVLAPRALDVRARARSIEAARTRSDASAPSGAEPSRARRVAPRRSSSGTRSRPSACSWKAAPGGLLRHRLVRIRARSSPPTSSPSATRSRTTPRTSPSPRWPEEAPGVATAHAVGAYPTTLWLREGRDVHRLEGALPAAALVQLTAKHLLTAEEDPHLRCTPRIDSDPRSSNPRTRRAESAPNVFPAERGRPPRLRARAR